jgi:hypothetical protein
MVEHGPGLGRNFEAERIEAERRVAIARAAQVGVEAILSSPRLNHTFCFHSGALIADGCDNPALRALDRMRTYIENGAQGFTADAVRSLMERALDEGVAVTTQRYEGHDFVTMSDSRMSSPSNLMRNNADPMNDIQRARLNARREMHTMSIADVLRGNRFVSNGDDMRILNVTEEQIAARQEAQQRAVASYVRSGLLALPTASHVNPVFKTYGGRVLAEGGHNYPGDEIAQVLAAEEGDTSLFFKEVAFTALLEAYLDTGRPVTRQNVGGSQFVTVGSEDSIRPRSFIRNNPALAA